MQIVTLNNGVKMPQLGFGVWKVPDETAASVVKEAVDVGYRSIDTAKVYKNERGVGEGLKQASIPREELFITTKLWNADQGYDQTFKAFDESLERLGLEYVDLYLIHWPTPKFDQYIDTYRALEKLYQEGRVKAIGVCNFNIEHLERLLEECEVVPVVNQVECHPYLQQQALNEFCEKHSIYLESYSPLMNGRTILEDPIINELAKQHGKTPAQIILRWHLQSNFIVIPKTVTLSRMKENSNIFDFELSEENMKQIASLDRGERINHEPSEMNIR